MRNKINEKVGDVKKRKQSTIFILALLVFLTIVGLICGSIALGTISEASAASAIEAVEVDEVPNIIPTLDLALQPTPTLIPSLLTRQMISPVFTPEVRYWEESILSWAERYGLDPDIVAIIMQIESCGDPQAISVAGAQGLFQVMPFHFDAGEDPTNPDTNARRGLNYFVERLAQTNGDVGRAFAGYNGGHVAAASSWDNWAYETQRYYIWSTSILGDIDRGDTVSPTLERWLSVGGASLCRQAATRLGI